MGEGRGGAGGRAWGAGAQASSTAGEGAPLIALGVRAPAGPGSTCLRGRGPEPPAGVCLPRPRHSPPTPFSRQSLLRRCPAAGSGPGRPARLLSLAAHQAPLGGHLGASITEGLLQWLVRPLSRCCQARLISSLMQHNGKEKEKASHGLGLRNVLTVSSVHQSSIRWFNVFHRRDSILKVMHITFNTFQEGNIFCRYFFRHK